ncbi:MAG: ATP-binding protein [Nitrospirota bacterium]
MRQCGIKKIINHDSKNKKGAKKRLSEIKRSLNFHKDIIQNMSTCLMITDGSRIIYLNDAACKTLGYGCSDLIGKELTSLFPVEERRYTLNDFFTIKDRVMPRNELDFVTKDKVKIPIGFTVTPFKGNDNSFTGSIIIFRDLTEIKRMEGYMRQIDKLTTLSQITAGLAHEIRNPLAGIKASAQVLEDGMDASDQRHQLTSRITKEIDRIDNLLKRFFNFARPSEPHSANYNIEAIIDSVCLLIAPQFKNNNVIFKKDFSIQSPQVYVDENQIEQVLMNIFLNAIQAMPEGGMVSVKTNTNVIYENGSAGSGNNRIKATRDGREPVVFVEITDTGNGISQENMDKIFNPFFTTKREGTGLGLCICKQIMIKNNGRIDIRSSDKRGTTVILTLQAFLNF